ncbi:vWA domain-containing protein [Marinobacter arenosus]|uniref:vWA domain-containing protein n=1 Tax=Marinobacter arenosus TaxID=2856822 RepID=UPI001C4C97FE|nr:vWA domain-containing protein [Marinobacter arenosus]MBW0146407.1 VWA domain-containing protein [Marinobacter arenosus]
MPKLLTLLIFTVTVFPATVHAQEMPAPALSASSDVRIIVDISGSMKENDPDNLRQPAVRLLARMIPDGTTAGLWTFGQYVNMLVPHRSVGADWREQAVERSRQINSVALRTNLGEAIEVASDSYYSTDGLENTHFILLTDGNVDISDDAQVNLREENRILESLVVDLAEQGATFHPIALSAQADAEFLRKLARKSGGRFQIADTADALNRVFLEALNTAVPQEQIPIVGNAFSVDEGVTEYTALVFWGERETRETRQLELIRPDGRTINLQELPDNIRWAREAGYDLMTVSEPMSGDWRINGELGEGSRVTVVSDLRMAVSPVPPTFSEAEPIKLDIAFFEGGERITDPDFLQVLEVRLSITSEDGLSGTKVLSADQPPKNGVFSDTIGKLPAPGLYQLEIIADGQTFGRKFSTRAGFVSEDSTAEGQADAEPHQTAMAGEPDPGASVEQEEPGGESDSIPEPEAPVASAITSPIDISDVEEPETVAARPAGLEDDAVSGLPVPFWAIGAGMGGVGLMALVGLAMKRRQAQRSEQARAAAERETVADLDEEVSEPEASEAEQPIEAPADDGEEAIPELDNTVEEGRQADEEEFGLDDFDLSEFDDLPEYDEKDSERKRDELQPKPEDSDQKK